VKFNFKIHPFRTEATENIVRLFTGQPKQDPISYRRNPADLSGYPSDIDAMTRGKIGARFRFFHQ
jgi:hypothetical protein